MKICCSSFNNFPKQPLSTINFAKLFLLKDILKDIDNLKKLQFLWLFMFFPPYISSSWILLQKWILIFKHICWRADDSLWLWLITAFGFLWKSIDNNIKVSKIKYIFCIFKKSGAVAVFVAVCIFKKSGAVAVFVAVCIFKKSGAVAVFVDLLECFLFFSSVNCSFDLWKILNIVYYYIEIILYYLTV